MDLHSMLKRGFGLLYTMLVSVGVSTASMALADQTTINIHADQIIRPVNQFLTGVCIEDVNHEIYGGLYSQMIFGESLQEPSSNEPIKNFRAYGGNWTVADQAVEIDGADGPELVSEDTPFADGAINVEMRFAGRDGENAGLIARVSRPAVGADAFTGYEISLDPGRQAVRLARHRQDYQLIADVPCDVPVGRWFACQVTLQGPQIEILVDAKSVLRYDDHQASLPAGEAGLRAWHCKAGFRNLSVTTGGLTQPLPFDQGKGISDVSAMWKPVVRGSAVARFALDTHKPFIGTQSQQMTFDSGEGAVGIANRGLNHWGLNFVAGKAYEGYVWAQAATAANLTAALESGDGSKLYAEQSLNVAPGDWQRIDFSITPNSSDHDGRFVLELKQPGALTLGYVFLQPGSWGRYKDLPVRRDVVQGLIDQGAAIMRYGGSMVNSPAYRWKNMIGPRDRRPPYAGTWYRYSSNGWGVIDFLNLCQATGIVGVPDLNVNETPADMADFIEYVNGSPDTPWGKRRAADGHPAPYHLTHLELGNEERVDSAYAAKFKALAQAIWAKDPGIILVVGDFSYKHKIIDPDHITGADSRITNLDGQRQILDFARQHNREVWFDVHVWSERLDPSDDLRAIPTYMDAIDRLANGAAHKVVVFELNANSHGQIRALANAVSNNTLRRDNRVPVVTSANGLQPDGQNDNGWDQGLLFFNPWQIWLQPPGYLMQMQARNDLPELVRCDVNPAPGSHLDVTATRSEDGKTLVLQVVNTRAAESAAIGWSGFAPKKSTAHVTDLIGPSNAANTAERPDAVRPTESDWTYHLKDGTTTRLFPAQSFTIIRFE